jgi:hypothetical protein
MSYYKTMIDSFETGHDSRHIEAFMRLEHGCLDGLSKTQFHQEVDIAVMCIKEGGIANAEKLAKSFGL